jgi:chromosome partitioning protein
MSTVVAFSNQKGGVGKTTSVVNIAAFCALAGKKTLVIDNDPQGNASSVLAERGVGTSIYDGGKPLKTHRHDGLWVIPAGEDLIEQESRLSRKEGGHFLLRQAINALRSDFDLILIDCPPNLSWLPTNAFFAADQLVVPLQCEYYALEGLSQLLAFIEEQRSAGHTAIELAGILLTMFDPNHALARQVVGEIRQHFPTKAYVSVIPRDVSLAAAPSHGQTILEYDPLSPGGLAYLAATKEFVNGLE